MVRLPLEICNTSVDLIPGVVRRAETVPAEAVLGRE
jgi:hypothetical protein